MLSLQHYKGMYGKDKFGIAFQEGFEAVRYELGLVYDGERGTDEDFLQYYDEELKKAAEYVHGDGEKPEMFEENTERMLERFSDEEKRVYNGFYDVNPASERITEFYEMVKEEFDRERYDIITGIAYSALPLLKTVENYFDADSSVINFSKYDAKSEKVVGDPVKDVDYRDADVLVIDDVICSGETLERTGKYLEEKGARNVDSLVMKNISADFRNISKSFEGVFFSIVTDYRSEGVVTHHEPVYRKDGGEVPDVGADIGKISLADL